MDIPLEWLTPDGGEAEIYADVTAGTWQPHDQPPLSESGPLPQLAEFTIRASAVIQAPGAPATLDLL